MLPYWGWQFDSQDPEKAPIWGDNLFGGNGQPGDWCVTTGKFKDWRPLYPRKECLKRNWDAGTRIGAFASSELVNDILSRITTYDDVRRAIEPLHNSPHVNIGGHMSTMYSPNDPIFYLHHANIDKLWANWQKIKPNYLTAYGGLNCKGCAQGSPDDVLLAYNVRVKDVFDTKKLCCVYEDLSLSAAKKRAPRPTVVPVRGKAKGLSPRCGADTRQRS